MSFGSRGKYHNVGLSDRSRLAATPRQRIKLRNLTGRHIAGLTRGQAAELIEEQLELRQQKQRPLDQMSSVLFQAMVEKAVMAADTAGDVWQEKPISVTAISAYNKEKQEISISGPIGWAYLEVSDKRTSFYKWLKTNRLLEAKNSKVKLPYKYADTYDLNLQIECLRAAWSVFQSSSNTSGLMLMAITEDEILGQH
ncbi:hypothetical protein [Flexibacterium corallicola]|uniref:hypothetical protein n=1 Tax=Flexibacterium corallicola TaxID=3037259 RepID=UPI00286F1FA9|nr:hypothetical protein [Pseudovibrio sp. M1P-2-3]